MVAGTTGERGAADRGAAGGSWTGRPRRRLGRRARRALLCAHVLAAVGWFGVAVTVLFCVLAALATDAPGLPGALHRTVQTAFWLSIPAGVAASLTGLALSLTTTWGVVRHWWVVAKEVIAAAVLLTDVFVLLPAATAAVDTGAAPHELVGAGAAHCVVLAAATVLSIVKPRGRTPYGRRASG